MVDGGGVGKGIFWNEVRKDGGGGGGRGVGSLKIASFSVFFFFFESFLLYRIYARVYFFSYGRVIN